MAFKMPLLMFVESASELCIASGARVLDATGAVICLHFVDDSRPRSFAGMTYVLSFSITIVLTSVCQNPHTSRVRRRQQ